MTVAKKYQNLGLPLSDLINIGNVGLIVAARARNQSCDGGPLHHVGRADWDGERLNDLPCEVHRLERVAAQLEEARLDAHRRRVHAEHRRERVARRRLLDGQGLELVWLKSPMDAYITHVNGSAVIRLPDGEILRLGYAGADGLE